MIKAFLYDARGHDREIELSPNTCEQLEQDQLLWIDVTGRDESDLKTLAELMPMIDRRVIRSCTGGERGRRLQRGQPSKIEGAAQ